MMGLYVFASYFITGGLRIVICLFLIYRLLNAEKPDKRSILIGVAGALVITIFLFLFHLTDFIRIALETIWIAVCAHNFQKADNRMSLFISIFFEIVISFWLFLFGAGMGILFHSTAFLDNTSLWGLIAVWLLHFLFLLFMLYIYNCIEMTEKGTFRLATVIALFGFIVLLSLSEQTILEIPDDTLNVWMFLYIVLMMSMLLYNMRYQYGVEKELANLKSEQAELLERDYTALNNIYTVNARLFHDFHNHIGLLRQFLIHKKYTEAIEYLDALQEPFKVITDTIWTGDETVDYLINSKATAAAVNQIHLQVQVEFPQHTNIRSTDLCTILGNLLDNALEAVKKIPDPKQRIVQLTIRRINQMLVIKVENHFTKIPVKENGCLKTSKKENGLHGWGLKSAQAATEKYYGMVRTSYEGDIFRTVATLSYHGVPTK